ncbi:hypothetical protein CVT26_010847 [Gymnopilus dilepis]|uniref:HTH La-type RNA-binding domain-containing protein n=1 Tax=Gymnopilus dilepis TaxID=231916 RepID=A0A409W5D6_9AGAR|nr:hypothetical protein CVT26_010847 [Gymnopilus dilepis]
MGAHEQHGYYPPPRQQQHQHQHQPQQGGQYLPPPPNGYDYSLPPHPSNVPPQHHQHQLPMPPPLSLPPVGAPGTPGVLGFGGAPLPPPQSTIPFPLDPVRYWLLGQLEYYLSPQNMAQDFFLRQRMDARGWIPIPLLASFNRVKLLTHDTQLVRDVLSLSQHVQVRGGMVRMSAWESFVLPDAKPSTVEDQPLPAVYQAANMGFWEEGVGFGVGQESQEEFEEEEEEEDVVFVMGEEAARGGSWSPDRRSYTS